MATLTLSVPLVKGFTDSKKSRQAEATLEQLCLRWPYLFGRKTPHRLLQCGITAQIHAAAPDLTERRIEAALSLYTHRDSYLELITPSAQRHALDGTLASVVSDAEVAHAAATLRQRALVKRIQARAAGVNGGAPGGHSRGPDGSARGADSRERISTSSTREPIGPARDPEARLDRTAGVALRPRQDSRC